MNSRLGRADNSRFLEQFRYTLITSQLLSDVPIPSIYKRQRVAQSLETGRSDTNQDAQLVPLNWLGLSFTLLIAFALAWSIHSTRDIARSTSRTWPLVLTPAVIIAIGSVLYVYFRRQWLQWIRGQAVESAASLVTSAQSFDAAVSASLNLIQEVELICRGYRL